MRYLSLLTFTLLLSLTISAQQVESFLEYHGGYLSNLSYQVANALEADDDNVLLGYDATNPQTGLNSIFIDLIGPDGELLANTPVANEFEMLAGGMTRMDDGTIWLTAQVNTNESDNYSDLRLLQFDPEDGIVTEYDFDNYRYESITPGMAQSGPERISFLVEVRDAHRASPDFELLTVNTANGELISRLILPNLTLNYDYASITKGADGNVLVATAGRVDSRAITVDVANGRVDGLNLLFPSNNCSFVIGAPYSINYLYDAELEVYLNVNHCLDVYEITQQGTVSVRPNNDEVEDIFSNRVPFYLSFNAVGDIYAYHEGRYELTRNDATYAITEFFEYADVGGSIVNILGVNEKLFKGPVAGSLSAVRIYELNSDNSVSIPAYADFNRRTTFTVTRSLGIGGGEILAAEEIAFGRESKILFYEPGGDLTDSIYLGTDLKVSPRGFVRLDNGDYLTSLIDRLNPQDRIALVRFNKEGGLLDTLFSVEEDILIGTVGYQATQGGDGNFYLSYLFDEFSNDGLLRKIYGFDKTGAVIFETTLSGRESDFSLERPVVDRLGNVYLINDNEAPETFQLHKFATDGDSIYSLEVDHGYPEGFYASAASVNQAGNKLLVCGGGQLNGGLLENILLEFDTETGDLLRRERLGNLQPANELVQAVYQPGADNILVVHSTFRGDAASIDERFGLNLSVFNASERIYETELSTSGSIHLLYDIVSLVGNKIFLGGRVDDLYERATRSILLSIDYTPLITAGILNGPNGTESTLNVGPNPATAQILASWDQSEAGRYELELFSVDGRRVLERVGEAPKGFFSESIDLSRLVSGAYLMRLKTVDGDSVQRIIKH